MKNEITVVRGLPGGAQVLHLDIEKDEVVADFLVDEVRGTEINAGIFEGHVTERTEVFDEHGSRKTVLDLEDVREYDAQEIQ